MMRGAAGGGVQMASTHLMRCTALTRAREPTRSASTRRTPVIRSVIAAAACSATSSSVARVASSASTAACRSRLGAPVVSARVGVVAAAANVEAEWEEAEQRGPLATEAREGGKGFKGKGKKSKRKSQPAAAAEEKEMAAVEPVPVRATVAAEAEEAQAQAEEAEEAATAEKGAAVVAQGVTEDAVEETGAGEEEEQEAGEAAPEAQLEAQAEPESVVTPTLMQDFKTAYRSQPTEFEYWAEPSQVEGVIPAELEGTFFRNGPGLFEIGGKPINQPFDGDGMICQLCFKEGRLFFRNKYVQTKGYVDEQAAGRPLYKGAFSTGNPAGGWFNNPLDLKFKNVANTHVTQWNGKLLALWEGGLPHELDPVTLETIKESDWDKQIEGNEFAAHYRVTTDASTGERRFVNFGAGVEGTDANIKFYEFNEQGERVAFSEVTLPGGAFGFYHDMVVTDNHYILVQNPVRMDVAKLVTEYVTAKCGIAQCLKYDPTQPTRIHVVQRHTKSPKVQTMLTVPSFTFHHVNAFEVDGGSRIIFDSLPWRSVDFSSNLDTLGPEYYKGGQRSEAWRLELDLQRQTVRRTQLLQRACEFAVVNPAVVGRPHSHFYALGANIDHPELWGPAQVLVKVSVNDHSHNSSATSQVWAPGSRIFPQEPTFVPRPNGTAEDDGWVIVTVYDGARQKTDVVILDAQDVAAGPLATIHLPHHIPPGLHGSWDNTYWGPKYVVPQPTA